MIDHLMWKFISHIYDWPLKVEVHSRYMVQLQVQPNRRSRSSLTASDIHWRVVYVNSWSFAWSSTFSTWSLTQIRRRRWWRLLSTLLNQRTSVAADDRVTIRPYMVRSRCMCLSCDYAISLRIFDPHIVSAVSGVNVVFWSPLWINSFALRCNASGMLGFSVSACAGTVELNCRPMSSCAGLYPFARGALR